MNIKLMVTKTCSPIFRSSRSEVFLRKSVLKICSKFTGEHPCCSVISIKLLCNFIELALQHGYSPVNLLHNFRTLFLRTPLDGCFYVFLKFKIKFNLNHFYISFIVNPSSKLSDDTWQKSANNVLMESAKQCHRSVTVKEIEKAPLAAVCVRNVLKENNLTTVNNGFTIADPSNITKYKRKFKKL